MESPSNPGRFIEQLYSDNLHEYYGILARHFIIGENYEKGAKHCRLACKKAEKAGSLDDAIAYLNKQIVCIEKLSQTEDVEKNLIDARTTLGLYYAQMGQVINAKATVDQIVDMATRLNYKKRVSQIYNILGLYKEVVEEDFPKSFEFYDKSIKIGEELNDLLSLVLANHWMAEGLSLNSEYDKALHYWKKALEIDIKTNSLWGISAIKAWIACFVYHNQGKIILGYETSDEALRIADESGDIYSKAHAYTAYGCSYYYKGYLEKAEEYLLLGGDFSDRINYIPFGVLAHFILGDIYLHMEKYKISQKHYKKAISFLQIVRGWPSFVNLLNMAIVRAKVLNNEKNIKLNELFKYHDDTKTKLYKSWELYYLSDILLNIDNHYKTETEDWIKKAIQSYKQYSMVWFLARVYVLYADLFKRKGDQKKAKEHLGKAIEIFQECGADGWAKNYEEELSAL